MLGFRLLGYNVYFLDCPGWLRKERTLRRLSKIGLICFSHQESSIARPGIVLHDQYFHSMRIGKIICSLENYQRIVKAIGTDAVMQTCVYQLVFSGLKMPIELLHSILSNPTTSRNNVWIPNTIITRSLLEAYPDVSNRCPRLWTVFDFFLNGAGRVLRKIPKLVSMALNQVFRRRQNVTEYDNDHQYDNVLDLQDYEVAYFPHQGVSYGGLFLKDHFYSSDRGNPFFYENIIHFELAGNRYVLPKSLKYYREKKIRNEDWQTLPSKKRAVPNRLFGFICDAIRHGIRGLDIDLLFNFAWIVHSIQFHQSRLKSLPKLKIVLIGHDTLFPATLSAACRLQGIQTIAVQERMIAAWEWHPLLIDHYFVIGPEAHYQLKSIAPVRTTFHELGPVRLKDHANARIPDMISSIREKYSWIVLALDLHSEMDWFENGRRIANNWRSNMVFYNHLLRLCNDFPGVLFLLKGKNTDFIRIQFFKDLLRRFRAHTNLLILEDSSIWTPFTSVASADIGVARHTSLADEMMALGKPVIFDDYDGYPSEIYDYGPDVIAYSYDDIRDKLARFFADPSAYNANLNNLRKRLYTVPEQPVQQVLERELMNIWEANHNSEQTQRKT